MEPKMSLQAKKELLFRMRSRYQNADRKEKTEILNGFIAATGYHRKYAASVLAKNFKPEGPAARRRQPKIYDDAVKHALVLIWNAANQICSKRLAPFLPEFVETLERFGHLSLPADVRRKLMQMSPASIDRLLKHEREKHGRGISTTKPSNLLKQRIKVRTFADWDEGVPGFFEADLVAHCGDRAEGPFLNSLVITDVATGWTEFMPLLRKSTGDVIAALETIRSVLPIPLFGLDTDNGCEFINYELLEYCEKHEITFTRSRAYKKNDQAHIEQKNGSVIRRSVGYDRFEGVEAVTKLLALYRVLRLYVNFFQPSCKLLKKTRMGSKTTKHYDKARTPMQRLIESKGVTPDTRSKLVKMRDALDPVDLFGKIGVLQESLWDVAVLDGQQMLVQEMPARAKTAPQTHSDEPGRLLSLKPKRPSKRSYTSRVPHIWRTRPDPLEGTYDYAKALFTRNPEMTSTQMLAKLMQQFPEQITGKELKTLQRRLAQWRREAMFAAVSMYESDTTYDSLPFTDSLRELTKKALNLASPPG